MAATRKKPLSRDQLSKEPERQLRINSKEVLEKFWESTKRLLDKDDPRTMKMVSEMFNLTKAPGGTTIYNATQINNAGNPEQKRVMRFEGIIAMLEDRDAQRKALAAPAPVVDEDAEEIQDAVTEDLANYQDGEVDGDPDDQEIDDFTEQAIPE
jgi:hypothetical protein